VNADFRGVATIPPLTIEMINDGIEELKKHKPRPSPRYGPELNHWQIRTLLSFGVEPSQLVVYSAVADKFKEEFGVTIEAYALGIR